MLTQLTADAGLTADPAISPDGKLVAYASDRSGEGNLEIWVQQFNGRQASRLTNHAADDREPAFSPDGSQIVSVRNATVEEFTLFRRWVAMSGWWRRTEGGRSSRRTVPAWPTGWGTSAETPPSRALRRFSSWM